MTKQNRITMISCALAFLGLQSANAADLDVFGGYTIGRIKPDHGADSASVNGWNASATAWVKPRIGFTADFAGLYRNDQAVANSTDTVNTYQYSFMGGPQFRILRTSRVETSVRALVGAAYGSDLISTDNTANQTSFAALAGSNVDIRLNRKVSLRLSPGLYITRFGTDQTQKSFRFSIGPVFHFGGES